MRTCRICRKEIQKFHSYHIDGVGVTHMACEMGRTPPSEPYRTERNKRSVSLYNAFAYDTPPYLVKGSER